MTTTAAARPYTDGYLVDYSEHHVGYEFEMFLWASQLCASRTTLVAPSDADARRLSNALVENFVLHLRNVIDFLFPKQPRPTDVVAVDFCAAGRWTPTISASLERARNRADKEIAHLTTSRMAGTPTEKEWDFSGLEGELRPLMQAFVASAEPARLASNVAKVL